MIRKAVAVARLSVAVVLASAAIWVGVLSVLSIRRSEQIYLYRTFRDRNSTVMFVVEGVSFRFRYSQSFQTPRKASTYEREILGFGVFSEAVTTPLQTSVVWHRMSIPVWVVVPVLAAYPTIFFLRGPLRRLHRRRNGLCLTCAYNLTGLPEPRCPECGTEFDPATVPLVVGTGTEET